MNLEDLRFDSKTRKYYETVYAEDFWDGNLEMKVYDSNDKMVGFIRFTVDYNGKLKVNAGSKVFTSRCGQTRSCRWSYDINGEEVVFSLIDARVAEYDKTGIVSRIFCKTGEKITGKDIELNTKKFY